MMELKTTAQFKKDYKRCKKRGLDMKKLGSVIDSLLAGEALDAKYRDHALTGNYTGFKRVPHPAGLAADLYGGSEYTGPHCRPHGLPQ